MPGALGILQVNATDVSGGAEQVCADLREGYSAAGHDTWLAVGERNGEPRDGTLLIPNDDADHAWARAVRRTLPILQFPVGHPRRTLMRRLGRDDWGFRGTAHLLDLPPRRPDVLQLHNLHEHYFDLRQLPKLTRALPTVLTLHDAWLMTGHCAHPITCPRWETGCGHCPDLRRHPMVHRDATASNWRGRQRIYAASHLHVGVPARWLRDMVERSNLRAGLVECRVVPNGVDQRIFHPADRASARAQLGVPADVPVMLAVGVRTSRSPYKAMDVLVDAMGILGATRRDALLVLLGEEGGGDNTAGVSTRTVGTLRDRAQVARWYAAADVLVHSARADTSPLVIAEALSCGLPVVATNVGGIPDLVVPDGPDANGILVPPEDARALAHAISVLLDDPGRRGVLADNAARASRGKLDVSRQVNAYLEWFRELVDRRPAATVTRGAT